MSLSAVEFPISNVKFDDASRICLAKRRAFQGEYGQIAFFNQVIADGR